jgi:dolichyl-phosphate-mannose--protein O-mannosyl transferase
MTGLEQPQSSLWERRFVVLLAAVTLLALVLRFQGIGAQPPIFDEVLAVFTAENFVDHGQFGPIMIYHPHLRSLFLSFSMGMLGKGAWGLRGVSLLLGLLTVPLLGVLVRKLMKDPLAGLLAAFLLAVDPVHITFSRQAIQEVHTAFFFLLGVYFFFEAWKAADETKLWPLPAAGLAFGLGLASKSHALFPLAVCLAFALYRAFRRRSPAVAALAVTSLGVLPATVYMATYLPWFRRGYGLTDWLFMQKAVFVTMVTHEGNPMDSLVDTNAALWFIKPLMGYGNFAEVEGELWVTVAMGNPLVWSLVLPAAVYLLVKARQEPGVVVFEVLFWISYLPLALTSRPVWVLSSIAVTPFAYALVGRFLSGFSRQGRRKELYLYLAAVLVVSLLLYPAAIGRGWGPDYLRPLVQRFSPH